MGNESSVDRGRYDDDETTLDGTYDGTLDGTSVFSGQSRDTGFSGVSQGTGMSSRLYGRSKRPDRPGTGAIGGALLNSGLIDAICGNNFFEDDEDDDEYAGRKSDRSSRKSKSERKDRKGSRESNSRDESYDSGGSHSYESPDEDSKRRDGKSSRKKPKDKNPISPTSDDSYMSEDLDSKLDTASKSISKESTEMKSMKEKDENSFESTTSNTPAKKTLAKPLASSFAKRCYFTKAGIGKHMQHYEGITLTGNTILMLASAMKLKGCPTICDEDLRRVEQTFPNQFSRLPDELLLSSGWRRISKYCNFSGKPIPDGVPFFHSKERCHPTGGYYFLLAASIGMERPSDVEPLTLDMLILLQTDFPTQCDQTPNHLIEDPSQWTLVTRFCFFSGGPINSEEDVYYQADFNGNPIYMLAFLSPNMTPEELYRLNDITGENALKSVAAVEEVETVYDLTDRDFDDLKLYHLGPCRALPENLLNPSAWEKVLPQQFMECRENALARAFEYEVHAQEAIAKAGKMVSASHSRGEQSYAGIAENQQPQPYDKQYPESAPPSSSHHSINKQQSSYSNGNGPQMQRSLTDKHHNGVHTQGSYVEMHQIGNGDAYQSSGDDGTLGITQQSDEAHETSQKQKEMEPAVNQEQKLSPSQGTNHGSQSHSVMGASFGQPVRTDPSQGSTHGAKSHDLQTGHSKTQNSLSFGGFHHSQSRSGSAPASDQIPKPDPSLGSYHRGPSGASSDQLPKPDPSFGGFHHSQSRSGSAPASDQLPKPDPFNHSQSRSVSAASSDQRPDPSQGSQVSSAYKDDDDDPSVDVISRAEDGTVGDNTINFEDPTVVNHNNGDDCTFVGNFAGGADDPSVRGIDDRGYDRGAEDPGEYYGEPIHAVDPSEGDVSTRADDPTIRGVSTFNHDDPTVGDSTTRADDPTVRGVNTFGDDPTIGGITTRADDPTVAGITTHADEPTMAATESDDYALHDYYRGIERQQYQNDHPHDEFPTPSSRASSKQSTPNTNSNVDFEFFQKEMLRVSIEENSFLSPQQSRQNDDNSDYEIYEELSSAPQESEYVSMQELDNDTSYNEEITMKQIKEEEEENEELSEANNVDRSSSLPTTPKRVGPPSKEATRITNYAGYGFAKQFSSTPRTSSLASPKYSITPSKPKSPRNTMSPSKPLSPRYSLSIKQMSPAREKVKKVPVEEYDDPSLDGSEDDEPSPAYPKSSTFSFDEEDDRKNNGASLQSHAASPQSRGSKSVESSYTQGSTSSAMRGARELLKKNRQERLALMSKRRGVQQKIPTITKAPKEKQVDEVGNENKEPAKEKTFYSHARSRSVTPNRKRFQSTSSPSASPAKKALSPATPPYGAPPPPKTPPSVSLQKAAVNNKDADFAVSPKSDISAASSSWTDEADGDKDSRRALILKMARNRMRSKKETSRSSRI